MDNTTPDYQLSCIISEDFNTTLKFEKMMNIKKDHTVMISSVMFAFGVVGNVLALIVLKRSDCEQKRKLFYRLVGGLTLTDLIGTVATSPVVISVYVNDFKWIGGYPMCQYFAFMMVFGGTGTMILVCFMAVERLLCIRHPYLYYTNLRAKHATYFLAASWGIAATIASFPLMGFGKIVLQHPCTWCFFDYYTDDLVDRAYNYLFAILALTTISVTVSCNTVVLYTLCMTKMRGISRNRGNSRQFVGYSRRYAECQMPVVLIGITVVFSFCYLPLMVRILINQTKLFPVDKATDLVMIRLASLNQILDPWVYILLRRELVWHITSTIKSLCSSKQVKEGNNPQLTANGSRLKLEDGNSSAGLLYEENQDCCLFCWHCICDPPQPRRSSSTVSGVYSYNGRRCTGNCNSLIGTTHAYDELNTNAVSQHVLVSSANGNISETYDTRCSVELNNKTPEASIDIETLLNDGADVQNVKFQENVLGEKYQ